MVAEKRAGACFAISLAWWLPAIQFPSDLNLCSWFSGWVSIFVPLKCSPAGDLKTRSPVKAVQEARPWFWNARSKEHRAR